MNNGLFKNGKLEIFFQLVGFGFVGRGRGGLIIQKTKDPESLKFKISY